MRRALNDISSVAPEWLQEQVSPDWFDRYGPRFDSYRLPKGRGEQEELRATIGADGWHLLQQIYEKDAPIFLVELPSVDVLRCVWMQQYQVVNGKLQWRTDENIPPKRLLIQSPYSRSA